MVSNQKGEDLDWTRGKKVLKHWHKLPGGAPGASRLGQAGGGPERPLELRLSPLTAGSRTGRSLQVPPTQTVLRSALPLRPTGRHRRPAHPHFRPEPHPCARTRPGPSRARRARRRRRSICRRRAAGCSAGRRGAAAGPGRPAGPARRAAAAGGVRTAPGCGRARR